MLEDNKNIESIKTKAVISYILNMFGFGFIALLISLVFLGESRNTIVEEHHKNIIFTFLVSLLLTIIGIATSVLLIGYFILLGTIIWFYYKNIKGIINLINEES